MSTISQETAEKILSSIHIPPRPGILTEILVERNKSEPSIKKIAQIVSRDVVLSAAMLKTVNSPFFGLRNKIDSIEQGVMTLGLNNVFNILTGLVLRSMHGNNTPQLNRFWDTAEKTAFISAHIASHVPGISPNIAYTVGLFHDCGIPLLLSRFPDYMDTLRLAQNNTGKTITQTEDERHNTNHAVVGYMLSRNWNLSDTISLTIKHHHNLDIFSSGEPLPAEVCGLIAIIQIAESISDATRMRDDSIWQSNTKMLMDYIGISANEFNDIREEIMNIAGFKGLV